MARIKNKIFILVSALLLALALLFSGVGVSAQAETVYIGGMPAGFTLGLGGAQVVGICEVLSEEGPVSPARDAGIRTGDLIVSIGGMRITTAEEIDKGACGSAGEGNRRRTENGTEKVRKSRLLPSRTR